MFTTLVNIRALLLYLLTQNNFKGQRSSKEANLPKAVAARLQKQTEYEERLRVDARKTALQSLIDAEEETLAKIQSEKNDKAESIGSTFTPKNSSRRRGNRRNSNKMRISDAADARFNSQELEIFIGSKSQQEYGQGYSSFLNAALSLALARFLKKNGGCVPNVLIFDSPQTTLSEEIETGKSRSLQRELVRLLRNVAVGDGFQMIATDGGEKGIYPVGNFVSSITLVEFRGANAQNGERRGFLLDAPLPDASNAQL